MRCLRFLRRKVILFLSGLLAFALLMGAISPWMAKAANPPSYESHTLDKSSSWRSVALFSHSVASGPYRLLAVAVMIRADESVDSVTYGGESLTLAKAQDGGGTDQQKVEIWYLVNPPVGTANVIVHLVSSANPSGIAAVNFTGVDQTTPIGQTAGADATSGTAVTTSITTLNTDSLIFGAASARGDDTDPFGPYPGIIELWDSDTGGGSYDDDDGLWGGELEAPTAAAYTFGATSSSSDDWAIACIELKAAPAPSFTSVVADQTAYKDGDTVTLTVTLADNNTACTITADFSNIDDQYISGIEVVVNWGTDGVDNNSDGHIDEPAEQGIYVITYDISTGNGKTDSSSYSVPVTATDGIGNSTPSSTTLALDNTAPPSPTGLTATAVAGGNIELSWTAPSSEADVATYNIYRSTTSGGQNYSSATYQVAVGTATYTDTSTTDSTTYYYVVRAEDIAGNTDSNTDEDSATADGTAPPAPTSLSATALVGGDIELNWAASSPETDVSYYDIYRATSSGGQNYSSYTYQVSVGTTTYTDTSTTDSTTYYYVVRAKDVVGNSETNTNEVSATAGTPTGPSFSSITSDQTVYKNGDTITLTVTLNNNNTGCTLTADFSNIDSQYVTGGESVVNWGTDGVDNNGDGHIDEPAEQGIYVITYLISTVNGKADASCSISVTATDAATISASSSISLTLDNTAPSAPTNLSATALSGGGIELSWTASSSGDLAQYNIYRATSSGGQSYTSPTYTVSSGITTYTDTSTTDSTTYYYVVRAQDNVGNIETNVNEASATAGVIGAPSFSSIVADSSGCKDGDTIALTVTLANHNTGCTLTADFSNIDSQYVTGGEAVVNWGTDGKDNDGDGHIDGPSEQGVYVIEYLISTVNTKADGSYSVPVTATDAATSSASSSISLTLDNTAPPAPTGLTASAIVGGSIQLSWTPSSPETDVSQYNIYRTTSSGGQNYSSPTYTVFAGTNSYTDTSTNNGQTYYYVVRAQDNVGNIETNTNEASATASGSGPPAPTGLTASAIAGGSIQLNWTLSSPETDVAQYNIYRAINSGEQNYASPLTNVSTGTSTYTDTTTTDGVTYYYVVRAQDAIGNNETNTNEASATADATAPPAPTNLSATALVGSGIQLNWTPSSPETDVSQYNIYRATSSGGQNYSSPTYSVSVGNIGYTDTSVSDGVTYYYVVRAQDAAGNIETNTNEVWATADFSGPSVNVSDVYLKYEEEFLYNLASSTDPGVPTVFARGKVDEVYLRLNLVGSFELNKTSSSIILFRGIGDDAEEVLGSKEIKEGAGWAEFIFHIDPPFDPDIDGHSRDALYWVDIFVVSTTDTINDFNFYFIYDTTSPIVPDFGITSFTPSSGRVSVSGKTWPDSSDPQQVEIFLNGASQGVVTADGAGNFSKHNLILAGGDNYITVQSTDKAGNKSELSAFLRQRYNSQNLLSIVIRSSHVVKSGSDTIPVKIIYAVTEPAQVTIYIYNLLGETVKEWSEWVNPGEEPEWSWLGDNMYSETVNNGVYIIKVIADNGSGRRENVTKLLGVLR